ncbi:hypothetical protein AcV7_001827 [Taiwanofungus camphoratus]|nr:hypothetical protein AcV7_001827 [Antrodia cinnamomea]
MLSFIHAVRRPIPFFIGRGSYLNSRRCIASLSHRQVRTPAEIATSCFYYPKRFNATKAPTGQTPASSSSDSQTAPEPSTHGHDALPTEYEGPLAPTFRRLKIFSLSSLTLTFALTPFMFVMETTSSLPLMGRFALAGVAMATSGVSTALVAWCGRPYVTKLRWLRLEPEGHPGTGTGRGVVMTTLTLGLHERNTYVYDTAFLVPASRPFATWELAEGFQLPAAETVRGKTQGLIPREETIAETMDKDGRLLGRWVVAWDEHGAGRCSEVGRVVRYFNVHPELLNEPIR